MRLILVDRPDQTRLHFYPLALGRPIWELRCGFNSLGEKLIDKVTQFLIRPAIFTLLAFFHQV